MQITPSRRRDRRRLTRLFVVGLFALAAVVVPLAATAGTVPPFDIESPAIVPDGGAQLLDDAEGSVKELGPLNSNSTKIGVIHNDAVPTLGLTNPNAQVDLRQAWLKTAKDGDGDDWLYFAWDRDSNTGSGFIAYEFMAMKAPAACKDYDPNLVTEAQLTASCNPWANRMAGDFLILWDQQGGSKQLYLRTWTGTAPNLTLSAPVALNALVSRAEYSADGFRGEAAINVTDAIFGGQQRCLTFANIIPSTVTGNSDTADYKDTILQPQVPLSTCSATITTDPRHGDESDMAGNTVALGTDGIAAVRDQAVIGLTNGSATPAGSVKFFLCEQPTGTCTTGGTEVGTTSIAGGAYPRTVYSDTAYVTAVGRYCWRGEYSGDAANGIGAKAESAATECFTVTGATPTVVTTATGNVVLGGTVGDSATLSGTARQPTQPAINLTGTAGAAAGGTITFSLFTKTANGCGTQVGSDVVVNVSGDGVYSVPLASRIAPAVLGTFQWVATYSGDSPNTASVTHNSGCDTASEEVQTTSVPSSLTSTQTWVPNDAVTISATAGGDLAGTAYFALWAGSDCGATAEEGVEAIYTTGVAVSGDSPETVGTSNTTAVSASGDYSWKVSFDSTNASQRDIAPSCHETSSLTIANGGTVSSAP